MPLSLDERSLLYAVEQLYSLEGKIPDFERMQGFLTVGRTTWIKFWNNPDVRKSLGEKGIEVDLTIGKVSNEVDSILSEILSPSKEVATTGPKEVAAKVDSTILLLPEQLRAIDLLLDFNDRRSDPKKLLSLGISTARWNGWLKMPAFREYYNTRVSNVFESGIGEVQRAFLDSCRRGDVSAIKFYYQVTGRHNDSNVDIQYILITLMEAINRLISDPEEKRALAEEIGKIAMGRISA